MKLREGYPLKKDIKKILKENGLCAGYYLPNISVVNKILIRVLYDNEKIDKLVKALKKLGYKIKDIRYAYKDIGWIEFVQIGKNHNKHQKLIDF